MNQDYDVVIVGAGLIGLAMANDLAQQGLQIALVDANETLYRPLNAHHPEIRASAINHSSEQYLRALGVWHALQDGNRVLTYDRIEVKERDGTAYLEAQAQELGYANLGYIVENQNIQNELYERLIAY